MVSARLERWIRSTYPGISADAVLRELAALEREEAAFGGQNPERVAAALAFIGGGDMTRFREAVELLRIDWRDVLVVAGLGNESWSADLERSLGDL